MGLCVLDEMTGINSSRQKIWERYKKCLANKFEIQKWTVGASQNFHYFPILFDSENALKKAQNNLNEQMVFPRRYFFPSLDSLPLTGNELRCVVSRDIASRILCLPMFPELSSTEQEKIIEILESIGITKFA
ncbi:MAG: hypothetical protein C0412_02565 [Flavobacterium sp.]|nr:hypothetical protein [Flavobacterium sp.]